MKLRDLTSPEAKTPKVQVETEVKLSVLFRSRVIRRLLGEKQVAFGTRVFGSLFWVSLLFFGHREWWPASVEYGSAWLPADGNYPSGEGFLERTLEHLSGEREEKREMREFSLKGPVRALTSYMQTPPEGSSVNRAIGKLLGPALGDQQQGSFSIYLWKTAFQDAFQRLCSVRAGGHEQGFKKRAHDDRNHNNVSDPIVESKVLPIPSGDLSFGSGAQHRDGKGAQFQVPYVSGTGRLVNRLTKACSNERKEKDFLTYFSSLPVAPLLLVYMEEAAAGKKEGAVSEALNAETVVERRLSGKPARTFPYTAAPVVYTPSSADLQRQ
ncbi:hypothetical protein F3Y22_tig00110630pilonHSYRG00146 [Hibiscus syriacus]|uniref:Uncharacterized protein n=1 Tax=Hibiscus syriacus TaxID=106335 RepID=A0A6A2ZZM2_HIBSY|nr:hypothetical protein F3Y22_tig00110630pilonHSYRG00146 [Hibiscus syriacus]